MRSLADLNTLACCVLLLSTLGCDSGDSSDAGFTPHEGAGNFEPSDDGSTPAVTFGQLRVEGTQIVDATGEAIQLKGPSSMWLNWEAEGYAENLDALVWMRDNWKLSVIRAAMGIEPAGAYLSNPVQAEAQARRIIENAITAGVYVIVDWHDHNAHLNQAAAVEFFAKMATDYGHLPNIIYEPFNEPEQLSWATDIKPYHEAVVAKIREIDPDNLIVLGTPNWSQFVDQAAAQPLAGTNLLYTLHFYSCTHTGDLRQRADTALSLGLPLFVTEWGSTHADGGIDGKVCLDEAQVWTDWMGSRGISWTAWKLDNCTDSSCYFASSGVPANGGWTDAMLQDHGRFVRDRMRD